MSWEESTDNNQVAGYYIYRDGQRVAQTAHTRYTDTGLETNTPYTYTVSAFDASGNVSEKSLPITITTEKRRPCSRIRRMEPRKSLCQGRHRHLSRESLSGKVVELRRRTRF